MTCRLQSSTGLIGTSVTKQDQWDGTDSDNMWVAKQHWSDRHVSRRARPVWQNWQWWHVGGKATLVLTGMSVAEQDQHDTPDMIKQDCCDIQIGHKAVLVWQTCQWHHNTSLTGSSIPDPEVTLRGLTRLYHQVSTQFQTKTGLTDISVTKQDSSDGHVRQSKTGLTDTSPMQD